MNTAPKRPMAASSVSEDELRAHYPEFARLLEQRQADITQRVHTERANLDEQVLESPGDDADLSVVDTSADYFLNLANQHHHELVEIREAMDRMHRGVFGVCESCDLAISLERLRNLPYARLCIDCQSTIEATRRSRRLQSMPKM